MQAFHKGDEGNARLAHRKQPLKLGGINDGDGRLAPNRHVLRTFAVSQPDNLAEFGLGVFELPALAGRAFSTSRISAPLNAAWHLRNTLKTAAPTSFSSIPKTARRAPRTF